MPDAAQSGHDLDSARVRASASAADAASWTPRRAAGSPPGSAGAVPPAPERAGTLPPAIHRLLTEFAATLRKHGMYPPGHPALGPALQGLYGQLSAELVERGRLGIQVGRDRLMVDEATTDPTHILLHGLAARLHGHQLLAITFRRGIQPDELAQLLGELAREPQLEGRPLGRAPEEELGRWRHIQLQPLRYDPLALGGADTRDPTQGSQGMWLGLQSVPFATDVAGSDLLSSEASAVAASIEQRLGDDPVDRMIAVQLFRLAENLASAEGEAAELLSGKMSELVFCLEPDTLSYLVELGREGGRLNGFLQDASNWMEPDAILELVRVAAQRRNDPVAPWLLRITSKLAMYADRRAGGEGAEADAAIRSIVERLVSDWELEDPRPQAYAETLRHLVRRVPGQAPNGSPAEPEPVEAVRIVQMSLELDEPSELVRRAAARLVERGEVDALLDLLEGAPKRSRVAELLWQGVSSAEALVHLLQADPPDFEALDRIVDRLGIEAGPAMLDVLATSRSRFVRRQLFDRIPRLGPDVLPCVVERLAAPHWYVVRNMLGLIREVGIWPPGFDVAPYLEHREARVRIEAFRLAVAYPGARERAICGALEDRDRRLVTLGLAAAEDSCPPAAEPLLTAHARDANQPAEIRTAAIRALARLATPQALAALVDLCLTRRWVFWKRLAAPSAPVLQALRALAERGPGEPKVAGVLRRAMESQHPEVREAVAAVAASEPAENRSGAQSRPGGQP